MAITQSSREFQIMQDEANLKTDALIVHRVLGYGDDHPNGFSSKIKAYAKTLSWDGTQGIDLYKKVAVQMMADGFGPARGTFPEVYLEILNDRAKAIDERIEDMDKADFSVAQQQAWAADHQYKEVDERHQPVGISREGLVTLSQRDAGKEERREEVVASLAQRAMNKIVDTMVAFDSKVDAAQAKTMSLWGAVTDALRSKKTKLAAVAATAIVAAGLTGSPVHGAEVSEASVPMTHAEMMQSMHEGRLEHIEHGIQEELREGMLEARADHMEKQYNDRLRQAMHEGRLEHIEHGIQEELREGMLQARADHMEKQYNDRLRQAMHEGRLEQMEHGIQEELQRGMHEARADYMEEQIKQDAMIKFSSHLQSMRADAVDEFSAGLDEAISVAEARYKDALNHGPAMDEIMKDPVVQQELLKSEGVRSAVAMSEPFQAEVLKLAGSPERVAEIVEDKVLQDKLSSNPEVKSRLLEKSGIPADVDLNISGRGGLFDIPGVKDAFSNDELLVWRSFRDSQVLDQLVDMPELHVAAFEGEVSQVEILDVEDSKRVLNSPEVRGHVIQNIDIERTLNIPDQPERRISLPEQRERRINLPNEGNDRAFTSTLG